MLLGHRHMPTTGKCWLITILLLFDSSLIAVCPILYRYAAAPSGVTLMYPGTLLDQMFDPRSQAWYLNALANPGKVVVSAPYLDPGGAGHIITISHTVYQVIQVT